MIPDENALNNCYIYDFENPFNNCDIYDFPEKSYTYKSLEESYIYKLPEEIMFDIFTKIFKEVIQTYRNLEDLKNLHCTSKFFHKISDEYVKDLMNKNISFSRILGYQPLKDDDHYRYSFSLPKRHYNLDQLEDKLDRLKPTNLNLDILPIDYNKDVNPPNQDSFSHLKSKDIISLLEMEDPNFITFDDNYYKTEVWNLNSLNEKEKCFESVKNLKLRNSTAIESFNFNAYPNLENLKINAIRLLLSFDTKPFTKLKQIKLIFDNAIFACDQTDPHSYLEATFSFDLQTFNYFFPNVEKASLTFDRLTKISNFFISPKIKDLSIKLPNTSLLQNIIQNMNKNGGGLEKLSLNIGHFEDHFFGKLELKNLKSLTLRTGNFFPIEMIESLENLEHLNVEDLGIEVTLDIETLSIFKKLKSLKIDSFLNFSNKESFSKLSSLTSLQLFHNNMYDSDSIEDENVREGMPSIGTLTNLTKLEIIDDPSITQKDMEYITSLTNLESFHYESCTTDINIDFSKILPYFKNLENLIIQQKDLHIKLFNKEDTQKFIQNLCAEQPPLKKPRYV